MINSRALLITVFILLLFIGLVVQLFSVQIGSHDKYLARAEKQQNKVYSVRAKRGLIFDRNKEIIAHTKDDVSLYADSRMLRNKPKRRNRLAKELAKIFKTKPEKYLRLIKRAKGNVCLEKKVSKEKSLLLSNLTIDGFYQHEDYTRIYPYNNITSHILGYVDKSCKGRAGFEKQYDNQLQGKDGKLFVENNAIGKTISIDYDNSISPVSGHSFYLTIDKVYQKILVNELKAGVDKYKGKSGIGIIINPNTGEILALANVPDFNPHQYYKVSDFVRRNRALTDTYEPGSTMKSIVMAMLLEDKIVNEKNIINVENGKYRIKGAWIRDTHKHKKLSVREILEESSNIGMVKLSDKINSRNFYKGLRDFGFGNLTAIDLIGETKGLLKKPNSYSAISKAYISHGYEISVTPIQMVMAYAALLNGGDLLQPYILKSIKNNDEVISEFGPTKIRKVISEETSDLMKDILLGVVENGTGSNAKLDNIYVGGKTGTAQKLIKGKYSNRKYNSSFVGFFPADKPEILCLILVDSPEIGRYGGQVAAPIFRNITKKILEIDFSIKRTKNRLDEDKIITENITIDDDEIKLANIASNEKKIKKKTKITKMPNLKNKSLREAINVLSELNIDYEIKGYGRVVSQSIKRGTKLKEGLSCTLKCSSKNEQVN